MALDKHVYCEFFKLLTQNIRQNVGGGINVLNSPKATHAGWKLAGFLVWGEFV